MSTISIGKHSVLSKLGEGAHSNIYLIRRNADAKKYALKAVTIDAKDETKFLEQARHEFRIAQMLDHPNLLKIYALETETDWLFRVKKVHLMLEYVKGATLDTAPPLSLPQQLQVFVQVAAGLVHMHKRGVYHGDLKPNNIMLGRAGEVKVIDYGLAWVKGEAKHRVQGTPEYMAPETARFRHVTDKSDIYNFGATMYRMVTGETAPSMAEGPMDSPIFYQFFKPTGQLNPKLPLAFADLIDRCLTYEPTKRPERVSEIQGALDHLADELVRKPADKLTAINWGDEE